MRFLTQELDATLAERSTIADTTLLAVSVMVVFVVLIIVMTRD